LRPPSHSEQKDFWFTIPAFLAAIFAGRLRAVSDAAQLGSGQSLSNLCEDAYLKRDWTGDIHFPPNDHIEVAGILAGDGNLQRRGC